MDLMNDLNEAGIDETLQEDLDYIANSNLPFEKFRNSNVLVTGATGLIGVSLVRALLCANRINNLNLKIYALIRNKEKAEKIYKGLLNRDDLELIVGDVNEKIVITGNRLYNSLRECNCIESYG